VSPRWWDDLWLNEGFATWLSQRVTRPDPDPVSDATAAHAALVAPHPRVHPTITSDEQLWQAFNQQEYSSLSAPLYLLEAYVGRDAFRRALQHYLAAHADGNAATSDLVDAIAATTGRDVGKLLAPMIDTARMPTVDLKVRCDGTVHLELDTDLPGALPVCVAYDRDGGRGELCTMLAGYAAIALPATRCPTWLLPLGGITPYAPRVLAPKPSAAAIADHAALLALDERRAAVQLLGDDADLRVVPMLVGGDRRTAALAAAPLLDALALAGPQRPALARWITTRLAPIARSIHLDDPTISAADAQLVELVSAAGDTTHAAEAIAHVKQGAARTDIERAALRIAATADAAVAVELIDSLPTRRDRALAIHALAPARGILDAIGKRTASVALLRAHERIALLSRGCHVDRATDILRLGKLLEVDTRELADQVDSCRSRARAIEPAIVDLLRR
jgi:alanyl aminopeptidase